MRALRQRSSCALDGDRDPDGWPIVVRSSRRLLGRIPPSRGAARQGWKEAVHRFLLSALAPVSLRIRWLDATLRRELAQRERVVSSAERCRYSARGGICLWSGARPSMAAGKWHHCSPAHGPQLPRHSVGHYGPSVSALSDVQRLGLPPGDCERAPKRRCPTHGSGAVRRRCRRRVAPGGACRAHLHVMDGLAQRNGEAPEEGRSVPWGSGGAISAFTLASRAGASARLLRCCRVPPL